MLHMSRTGAAKTDPNLQKLSGISLSKNRIKKKQKHVMHIY